MVIGSIISHYKILSELGRGGMGVVYKAEDTKLRRIVALKFLPVKDSEGEEAKARFLREAQAAAALNHPHIATIYEIDEAKGKPFIAMEYVDGGSLKDKVAARPLKLEEALGIAIQAGQGLQAAHEQGISHRDVKSANIMLTRAAQVKIMDFGLAHVGDRSQLTKTGSTLGTPAYMSPEQALGKSADRRSDIWSLGVVIYEMVTGRLPFQGERQEAVLYAIGNEDPEPITALRAGLPMELERIVGKALAKETEDRYQYVEEMVVDLRAVRKQLESGGAKKRPTKKREVRPAPSEAPRLAVLPLKTRGGDAELESFAEGLTEEITAGLSRFRHLSVVTASAAARHDRESADALEVGKELRVGFLLEGRVRKAANGIRVNVQLLDTRTGTDLWAERFDRDLVASDIFEAQDELTDRIVATAADPFGILTRSLAALVKSKPIDTLTADECVLRWFSYWGQVPEKEHGELRTAIERALEREPNHADAHACLCFLYIDEIRHDYNKLPDPAKRALRTAQRAVQIDATSPLAYRALAEAHFFRGEIGPFRQAADRVLALNPRDTSNVGFMGTLISYSGDWETGCPLVRQAIRLNPHHGGWMHIVLSLDHCRGGEHEQALVEADQINMPGYPWASGVLAITHAHLGHSEEARKHLNTSRSRAGYGANGAA